jgi:hypothetical protein
MTENLFITDIVTYLAANSGGRFSIEGDNCNLKVGELVRGVEGIYAITSPSPDPNTYTAIETHTVDFWAQRSNSREAFDDLRFIYNLFHQAHHYQTDTYYIHFSYANGQVADLDRDGEGSKLLRIGVTFIIMSLIS